MEIEQLFRLDDTNAPWFRVATRQRVAYQANFIKLSLFIALSIAPMVLLPYALQGTWNTLPVTILVELVMVVLLFASFFEQGREKVRLFLLLAYPLCYAYVCFAPNTGGVYALMLLAMPVVGNALCKTIGCKKVNIYYTVLPVLTAFWNMAGLDSNWAREMPEAIQLVFLAGWGLISAFTAVITKYNLAMLQASVQALLLDEDTGLPSSKAYFYQKGRFFSGTLAIVSPINVSSIRANLGYDLARLALQKTAFTLNRWARLNGACVYKLHGYDFCLLIPAVEHPDKDTGTETMFDPQALLDLLEGPLEYDNGFVDIFFALGLAFGIGQKMETVMSQADQALHQAKTANKQYVCFAPDQQHSNHEKLSFQMLRILSENLRSGTLQIWAQDIIRLDDNSPVWRECLVRFCALDGSILLPGPYIQLADSVGLSNRISDFMITAIERQFSAGERLWLSINLGLNELLNPVCFERLEKLSEYAAGLGSRLVIEILESTAVMDHCPWDRLAQLREKGAYVAIDDFGAGFSNLSRLLEFSYDIVKFDGSLIQQAVRDKRAFTLLQGIVDFCRISKVLCLAEYVESDQELAVCQACGINFAQGFYFDRPKLLLQAAAAGR